MASEEPVNIVPQPTPVLVTPPPAPVSPHSPVVIPPVAVPSVSAASKDSAEPPTSIKPTTPQESSSKELDNGGGGSGEETIEDNESSNGVSMNGTTTVVGFTGHPVGRNIENTLSAGVAAVVAAMEFDEYESLPSTGVAVHLGAGAVAGVMEHCVMYPMDSVKTRMQSLQPVPGAAYSNIYQAFSRIIRQEGLLRPMKGMSIVVLGAGPAHALYFACYEKMKVVLASKAPTHYNHLAYGLAGCMATVFHDGVMTPADVVKQRMQMFGSPYKSCWQAIRQIYKQEGSRAFYRSYTTQLTMNVPFQSLHFMAYELMQGYTNPERNYNPKAHVVSGAVAGAIAAAVTTPLDVCKTLLNTQEATAVSTTGQSHITGLSQAFRTVYRLGGVGGFFQGATARVLYQMPSTAICWSTYEFFKYILQKKD